MTAHRPIALAARIQAETERPLEADDVLARLAVPITDDEREGVLSLVRWFRGRYPEPADRLAYVRRAYARWLGLRRAPTYTPHE